MSYAPSLAYCPAGMDACAYWRMWIPHINLPGSRFVFSHGVPAMNEIAECDVMVVQRLMEAGNMPFLKLARTHGVKIIYDLDDDLWNLPKYNPAAQWMKQFKSSSHPLAPVENKGLQACVEWADILTVSTAELAKVVSSELGWIKNAASGKRIPAVVIDNCVDPKLFEPPLWSRDPDEVVIGWGGSNTHSGDVEVAWNCLPDIVEEFPNVKLEIVGHAPPQRLHNHPRVRVREWCHISEFARRYSTWNWDIVLAPLTNHRFNRSKSSIKMQEAAALSAPCLASDVAPYRYFCGKERELNWLLCGDGDWKPKLRELVRNRDRRKTLGKLMQRNLYENFNISRTAEIWKECCWQAFSA